MKVAHVAIATPGRCGLYETTRELVAAERALGADARIVDPSPGRYPGLQAAPGTDDRGAPIEPIEWAKEADWLIDHSGLDTPALAGLDTPIVYMSHGRPASSFIGEHNGGAPVISYWLKREKDPRCKAVVTFWREHRPYLEGVFRKTPVYDVQPCVDLQRWHPGPTSYNFMGKGGTPNVVIADMWRDDINPMPSIAAFLVFANRHPAAKLHIYALPENRKGIDAYLRILADRKLLGVAQGFAKGLVSAYRVADLVISPQTIYTRSVREAMATGCRVVSGKTTNPLDITAFSWSMDYALSEDRRSRAAAERMFNPLNTAREFLGVLK